MIPILILTSALQKLVMFFYVARYVESEYLLTLRRIWYNFWGYFHRSRFNGFFVGTGLFDRIFSMIVANLKSISCFTKKFEVFPIFMFVLGEANIYLKKRWTVHRLGWPACLIRWRTTVLFSRLQSHIQRTRGKILVMNCKKGVCSLRVFEKEHREQAYLTRGLQRDVVYFGWPISPSYMSPNAGGGGGEGSCGVSANEYSCTQETK